MRGDDDDWSIFVDPDDGTLYLACETCCEDLWLHSLLPQKRPTLAEVREVAQAHRCAI